MLSNGSFAISGFGCRTGLRQFVRSVSTNNSFSCHPHVAAARNLRAGSRSKRRFCSTNAIISSLQIDLVPCLTDNYAYLLHDTKAGVTAVVDPSAAGPVVNALKSRGLSLEFILNTHHHWDHTGGNAELKRKYNAKDILKGSGLPAYFDDPVVGPRADEDRIPGIDISLGDGDTWTLGDHQMQVLDTPGHTRGHVSFYFPDSAAVFTGDTLFSMGCGRMFEGSAEQMNHSLMKISQLPEETQVYCGHEYTLSNAKFAMAMEPNNQALLSKYAKVTELRQKGIPTIPSKLRDEKTYNPFLRLFSSELRKSLNLGSSASDVETFKAVRSAKDRF